MRRRIWNIMILLALSIGIVSCGSNSQKGIENIHNDSISSDKDIEYEVVESSENENKQGETGKVELPNIELGDSWKDYQVSVDGYVYQFPMYMKDIISLGWKLRYEEDGEMMLEPYMQGSVYMEKGGKIMCFYAINLDINTLVATDCIAAGCRFELDSRENESVKVDFPGGLNRNSTLEDIIAQYGKATDEYRSDDGMYIKLTYQKDYHESYEFIFMEGKMNDFEIRNYVEPDDFQVSSVSDQIPDQVLNYEKPQKLDMDIMGTTIEMDGALYKVPFPVSELLANGWELEEDGIVESGYYGYCEVTKDNKTARVLIKNHADFATSYKYCVIEKMELGYLGEFRDEEAKISAGISVEMNESQLLSVLKNSGVDYDVEDTDLLVYYAWGQNDLDDYHRVVVSKDTGKISITIAKPYKSGR